MRPPIRGRRWSWWTRCCSGRTPGSGGWRRKRCCGCWWQTGCIGAVTTHDLSLAELARAPGSTLVPVHFQDVLEDGRMRFDYTLRQGVVQSTNALRVLRPGRHPGARRRTRLRGSRRRWPDRTPTATPTLTQPHQRHLSWKAEVDFARPDTAGDRDPALRSRWLEPVDLDTRGLVVESVTTRPMAPRSTSSSGRRSPSSGSGSGSSCPPGSTPASSATARDPEASALQWLDPEQTAGGRPRSSTASARPSTRARWCRSRTHRGCASPTRPSSPSPRRSGR